MNYGFFRVAAAAPRLRVADPDYNAGQLETVIDRAVAQQVRLLVTPELSVTGYTWRRSVLYRCAPAGGGSGRCSDWLPIRRARTLRC